MVPQSRASSRLYTRMAVVVAFQMRWSARLSVEAKYSRLLAKGVPL